MKRAERKDRILVVIPAYNEEADIVRTVEKLKLGCPDADYIIVNDGSKDRTQEICEEHGFSILELSVNLGLAGAFQAGMRYAHKEGYAYAVQFDGDGQHRPEYIDSMRKKMEEGYDIVIASRFIDERKPWSFRMLGSRLISAAIYLTTGKKIQDPTSGMRMFNHRSIEEFACNMNYGPEPDTVSYLIKQGARVAEVPAVMDERIGGVSYLTPVNAAKYMLRMLISILLIQNFRKRDSRYIG